MACIKQKKLAHKAAGVAVDGRVDLLSLNEVLPLDIRTGMMNSLRQQALKKVLMWGDRDEQALNNVSYLLKPVIYPENFYIVQAGDKLDFVVYNIEGVIDLTDTASHCTGTIINCLKKGDYYGEELLNWASLNYQLDYEKCSETRPISNRYVKCHTKVEALSINVKDLHLLLKSVSRYYSGQKMLIPRPPPPPPKETNMPSAPTKLEEGILKWVSTNSLQENIKKEIMDSIKKKISVDPKLGDVEDVHEEFLLSILPLNIQTSMKSVLGMNALNKVPLLKTMNVDSFKMSICDYLMPVTYGRNTDIVLAGTPIDLIFIIDGVIWTVDGSNSSSVAQTESSSSITHCSCCFKKGDFVGGELLNDWATPDASISELPNWSFNAKCHTRVEAFILSAADLRSIVSEFGWRWNLLSKYRRKSMAVTGASTSTTVEQRLEQIVQLQSDMLVLLKTSLDEIAASNVKFSAC